MNASPGSPMPDDEGTSDSTDAQNIIIEDTEEAHQVRKPSPYLLKIALAERDKILKWGGSLGGESPAQPKAESP